MPMANNTFTPLWQQQTAPDTREPDDLPTSDLGEDAEIANLAKSMVDAEFGKVSDTKASKLFSDSAFYKPEEPSIVSQISFGLREAWLGDPDSMVGTTASNLKKYLIAENPKYAATMNLRKETDTAQDSVTMMEMLKNTLAYKGSPFGMYEMAVNVFQSKDKMEAFEENYIKEHYGEDWLEITPDERRKRMDNESNALLAEQFPDVYGTEFAESGWAGLGNLTVIMADPLTYAAPAATSYKAASLIGATYGAIDASTKGLADKGYIDGKDVAIAVAAGGILGPVLRAGAKGAGRVYNNAALKAKVRSSSKILNRYERNLKDMVSNGADWNEAVMVSRMMSKVDGPTVDEMYKVTGRSFNMETAGKTTHLMTDVERKASNGFFYRAVNGTKEAISPYIVPITDVLRKNTPKIFQALRDTDARMHFRMHSSFTKVAPWLDDFAKMKKADQIQVKKWISSGNKEQFQEAEVLMQKYASTDPEKFGKIIDKWLVVRRELKETADAYTASGHKMELISSYFPRIAKNPNKANDAHLGWLSWKVTQESKRLKRALSEEEIGDLFSRASQATQRELSRAPTGGSLRDRIVPELNDYLEPHYANPAQALHSYFRTASRDIERANFFNRFSSKKRQYKIDGTDLDDIVDKMVYGKRGDVVDEVVGLSDKQRDKIADILRFRFGSGEQSPRQWIQTYKNLGYTLLLGNPLSAMTQLGDQAFSMYRYGVRSYIKALVLPKVIDKEALGLTDAMEELFANTSTTKRLLDWSLKWSGFNKLDKFGKDMILNSAYRNYMHLAKSPKGRIKIKEQWGRFFEGETADLIKGLQKGDINSENVRLLLWHELADVQPIALSEMPEKYLKSPNGRIFYMLKTFTIKQLSFMKRTIFEEAGKGNHALAARRLLGFTGAWLLANGTADGLKDILKGNDPIENIPDNVVENLAQMTGLSKYTMEAGMREGPIKTVMDFIMPPVPFVDELALAGIQGKPERALKAIPWVGNIIYQNIKNRNKGRTKRRSRER